MNYTKRHFITSSGRDRYTIQLLGENDARKLKLLLPNEYAEAESIDILPEAPESVALTMPDGTIVLFDLFTERSTIWKDLGPEGNYARSFAKFLKLKIDISGLTQDEVCRRADISPPALTRILRHGRIPDLFETMKLARVLEFDPRAVFFDD